MDMEKKPYKHRTVGRPKEMERYGDRNAGGGAIVIGWEVTVSGC